MHNCSSREAPVVKGDKCSKSKSPKAEIEDELMKHIQYVAVRSLIYAYVCTRPNFSYVVSILGRFQANLGM